MTASETPSPRPRNAARTRQAILDAAMRLFAERGFGGTSLADIGDDVGIAKSTVAYHFKDKTGLFTAILADAAEFIETEVEVRLDNATPVEGRLREFIHILAEMISARPALSGTLIQQYQATAPDDPPEMIPLLLRFSNMTRALLTEGVESGLFRQVDWQIFHLTLIGSLGFFVSSAPLRARRPEIEAPDIGEMADTLADLLIDGLIA